MEEIVKMEINANGNYRITYKNIDYEFEGGKSYKIDEETAKQFVECGYCSYAKIESGTNKSKKTNNSEK